MEDGTLIRRIKSGDIDSLDQLIQKYYGDICAYCCRKLGRRDDAEDVTQEVFLHFCRNFDDYTHKGKCRSYLYAVAHNLCVNAMKKKTPFPEENAGEESAPGSDTAAERLETADAVRVALEGLPEEQREAVFLRFYRDFKLSDIARVTGSGLSVTKYRLRQGLKALEKALAKEGLP